MNIPGTLDLLTKEAREKLEKEAPEELSGNEKALELIKQRLAIRLRIRDEKNVIGADITELYGNVFLGKFEITRRAAIG